MTRALLRSLALALLALALAPALAFAHVPVLEPAGDSSAAGSTEEPFPDARPLPDPTVSRAVYGVLLPGSPYDVYTFTPSKDAEIPLSLLVPVHGGLSDFRPALALIAEDAVSVVSSTPPPPNEFGGRTPIRHPDLLLPREAAPALVTRSVVVVRDPGDTPRGTFFEPFSLTRYWRGGEMRVKVLSGQRYWLVVWADGSAVPEGGGYVVGVGEAERFTPGDWVTTFGSLLRIETNAYGGASPRPGRLGWVVLVLAAIGVFVWWRRRRRTASAAGGAEE